MDPIESARQEGIRRLCAAQAENLLTVEAFEERFALVKAAPSASAVLAIVADLEHTGEVATIDLEPFDAPIAPADHLRVASILGTTRRDGKWTVPHHLEVKCILGETLIDLRDAMLGSDLLDIDVDCILGTVRLIVPPGTQVENECHELLASSSHRRKGGQGYPPSGLLVRIDGRVILGELVIRERPSRDAKGGAPRMLSWWRRLFGAGSADDQN